MYDRYNRKINYLRISVTDRCNLRCRYCMPPEGIKLMRHDDILSYDEITDFVKTAVQMGIDKVRLTGGEPLVRKGLVELVKMITGIDGIKDFAMSTNGTLLEQYARPLSEAGLQRVNVSLDSMDPHKFRWITRGGNLDDTLKGIDAAIEAGLTPVKLNCVVKNSKEEYDAKKVKDYADRMGLEIRYIKQMNLERGEFAVVEGGDGGNCIKCNRLRLTANGKVKPCLFNDLEYSVRELGAKKAIKLAVENKPECGTVNHNGHFYNIGG
ncbi:MAG TPA: radical SAM protein [Bacteroidales bacterium]|nr:radical SAM protein [Bacteroidales bacterium]